MRSLPRSLVAAGFALALIAVATTAGAGNRNHRWRPYRPVHNDRPVPAIPEPTGVLTFAAGLFAVRAAARRRAAR